MEMKGTYAGDLVSPGLEEIAQWNGKQETKGDTELASKQGWGREEGERGGEESGIHLWRGRKD